MDSTDLLAADEIARPRWRRRRRTPDTSARDRSWRARRTGTRTASELLESSHSGANVHGLTAII